MKNIYNERLLMFAKHLEKIKDHPEHGLFKTVFIIELEVAAALRSPYPVRYHEWIFEELPACFDEWEFDEKFGYPRWIHADLDQCTAANAIDFFDLSQNEFEHLFDVDGFQHIDQFGGKKLDEESDGPAIANNIIELVKRKK